jgi:uncharacterized GH25 family protein
MPQRKGVSSAHRVALITATLVLATVAIADAHDMFIKPANFFAAENSTVFVRLLNGTYSKSENSIARPRIRDIAIVGPNGRFRMDTTEWSAAGDTSTFNVKVGSSATYVVGVSTAPNVIALTADEFNTYLADDGIPDELAQRKKEGSASTGARERYHKHVKSLIQVGDTRSDHYATVLGYPAELVPVENPYALRVGQSLRLRTLVDGKAMANQYVLYGGRTPNENRIEQRALRSDANGVVTVPLRARGTWYVKFINMTRLTGDTSATHESKWATITFAVR